jgi:hypothetical protein
MSIKVQHVDPNYIHQVWSTIEPLLKPVFEKSNTSKYYSIDNLKEYLIRGEHTLLVGSNSENSILGCVTVQWLNYPGARVAYVSAFGGNFGNSIEHHKGFIDWLKVMGATRIECSVRPSVARLLQQKSGYVPSKQISMELVL